MPTFDYQRPLAAANRMLPRFGQVGAVRRTGAPTGPSYDPTPGAAVDHPATFVITDYANREVDGTRILSTDRKVIMAPGSLSIQPATTDKVIQANGEALNVVNVEVLNPAGTALLFTLQCRR